MATASRGWTVVAVGLLMIVATAGLAGCVDGGEDGSPGGEDAGGTDSGDGADAGGGGAGSAGTPADWPMHGFDAGNSASYGSPGDGNGDLIWESTSTDEQSSPAIANGLVLVGEEDGMSAWDVETGEQAWWFDDEPEPPTREDAPPRSRALSTPVLADGTVYVASRMSSEPGPSHVLALDAETGEEEWRADVGNAVDSAPSVAEGLVFFGTQRIQGSPDGGQAAVHAVDADSGEEAWTFELGTNPNVYGSPIVSDGSVFFGTQGSNDVTGPGGLLYKLDTDTGEEEWKTGIPGTSSSLAVGDGTVFVDARDEVIALDEATGDEVWTHEDVDEIGEDPAYADGNVYVLDTGEDRLIALDADSGEELWVFEGGVSPPALAGGTVFATSFDEGDNVTVHALDASSGQEAWTATLGPADEVPQAAFAGGTLVVTQERFPEATIFALEA